MQITRPWEELSCWEQELFDAQRAHEEHENAEYWRELGEYEDWLQIERRIAEDFVSSEDREFAWECFGGRKI